MKIGFIGVGEASSNIMLGLSNEQYDNVYYAYDTNDDVFNKISAKVIRCNSIKKLLEQVEVVFVAVPGKCEENIFSEIVSYNLKNLLIIDICTSNPINKKKISNLVEAQAGVYVDAAVLGSIPKLLHKTPMMISGNGSKKMKELFSEYNMNLTIIEGDAGKASTIKLCRSIFMKGLPALAIETKKTCEKYGVTNEVFSSIYENLKNQTFEEYLNRLINGAYKHSVRQRDELLECINLEKKVDIQQNMTKASVEVFEELIDGDTRQQD